MDFKDPSIGGMILKCFSIGLDKNRSIVYFLCLSIVCVPTHFHPVFVFILHARPLRM
jgi:hypothetical protein